MDYHIIMAVATLIALWLLSAMTVHYYRLSEKYAPSYARLIGCEKFIGDLIYKIRSRPDNRRFDKMLRQVVEYRHSENYLRIMEQMDEIRFMDFNQNSEVSDVTVFALEFKPLEIRFRSGGGIKGWQRNGVGLFDIRDLERF